LFAVVHAGSPFPRLDEPTSPHPAFVISGGLLIRGIVISAVTRPVESPSRPDEKSAKVLVVSEAARHYPAIPIAVQRFAADCRFTDEIGKRECGLRAAKISLLRGIQTGLPAFRGIDASQSHSLACYL
jgi:hypothetical protein